MSPVQCHSKHHVLTAKKQEMNLKFGAENNSENCLNPKLYLLKSINIWPCTLCHKNVNSITGFLTKVIFLNRFCGGPQTSKGSIFNTASLVNVKFSLLLNIMNC